MRAPVKDKTPWHFYVTNRHRKTDGAASSRGSTTFPWRRQERQRLGERRRKNGREWARKRSRSTVESVKCVEVFSRTVRRGSVPCNRDCTLPSFCIYPADHFSFLFLSFLSYRLVCSLTSFHRLSLSLILSLSLFVSAATLDIASCITRRHSRADHTKRHS